MAAPREKRAFVSSTAHDLRAIREEVRLALRRFGYIDVGMEYLAAEDIPPLDKCLAMVRESDLFVLLVALRYGYIPPGQSRSITELEYDAARQKGIPCIVLLLSGTAPWRVDWVDRDASRVEAFRGRVAREQIVAFFEGRDDAAARLYESLRLLQQQTATTVETDAEERRLAEALDTLRERQQRHHRSFRLFDFHEDIHVDDIYVQEVLRSKAPKSPYDRLEITARQMSPPMRDSAVLARISASDHRTPVSVFEGRAGAGKSTMLKMWLLTLLGKEPQAQLFPLFGSLRHLQPGDGSPVEMLTETICRSTPGVDAAHVGLLLVEEADAITTRPPVVLLLDGLDEMAADARSTFVGSIASLPFEWAVVVSTRPGVLGETGYPVRSRCYELCDFDEEQIRAFVQRWFAKEPALAAALLARIESSSRLRALAAIPLLLTCLAIHVQVYGGWTLPANVAEDALLRHSVEILIDGWDAAREKRRPDVRFLETSFRVFAGLTTHPRHENVPFGEFLRIVERCIGDPAGRDTFIDRVLRNGRIVTGSMTEGVAFSHAIFYDFFFAERLGTHAP